MKLVIEKSKEIDCTEFGFLVNADRRASPGYVVVEFETGVMLSCTAEQFMRCRVKLKPETQARLTKKFEDFLRKNPEQLIPMNVSDQEKWFAEQFLG